VHRLTHVKGHFIIVTFGILTYKKTTSKDRVYVYPSITNVVVEVIHEK